MRVIINADDCGLNSNVNQHIRNTIEAGKITSTTIMANMDDIDGALRLYEEYHNQISFGIHLNLTQGQPILNSQKLLDYGYCSEKDGQIVFDSNRAENYRYKILPKVIKREIYKEFSRQIEILQKRGVRLSHLDSHHHIHTCFSLLDVIAQLSLDYNIPKIRRIRNYVPRSLSFYGRQAWATLAIMKNHKFVMSDYFASFEEFVSHNRLPQIKSNDTIELMIHPGHRLETYQLEEKMMLDSVYPVDFELISYNEL